MKVNYILHHQAVSMKMAQDDIRHTHIALYNALFLIWNNAMFPEELSVNRQDVMSLAKIGNANTYTKLMKDLHDKKYIVYKPSHNPLIGSKVTIIRCDKGSDTTSDKSTDISSGKTSDKGSGASGDTLYKLVNYKTYKLIEDNVSVVEENLEKWLKYETEKVSEEDSIFTFEEFWEMYDNKKSMKPCKQKYSKISEEDRKKIKENLPLYVESTTTEKTNTDGKRFRKDPKTWLNQECWNDEIKQTKKEFDIVEYYKLSPEEKRKVRKSMDINPNPAF
jgi:hypothetical protein